MEEEKILRSCRGCGEEIDIEDYYPSRARKSDWLCPKCCQEGNKQYMLKRRIREYLEMGFSLPGSAGTINGGTRATDDREVTGD